MTNGRKAEGVNHHLKICVRLLRSIILITVVLIQRNNSKLHLHEKGFYKLSSLFLNNVTTLFKY